MEFTVSKDDFSPLLQKVASVIPMRTSLPMLYNIVIESGKNKITVKATDLDISIRGECKAEVKNKGKIAIQGKVLSDFIREYTEEEINISGDEGHIEIKSKRGKYSFSGVSEEEFPKLPDIDVKNVVEIPGGVIRRMVRKSQLAVARDDSRPALSGILWRGKGEEMVMVATNGHLLSKVSYSGFKNAKFNFDVIVPPKAFDNFLKLYGDSEDDVKVAFSKDILFFLLDEVILTARLIEGPYPNFEQVIPTNNDKKIIIDKEMFLQLIRQSSILASNITHQIKLSFSSLGTVKISATNFDIGTQAEDEMDVDYKGDDLEIAYNSNYLLDILKHIDTDKALMELSSSEKAGVVRAVSYAENEDYLYLIMPLRLA